MFGPYTVANVPMLVAVVLFVVLLPNANDPGTYWSWRLSHLPWFLPASSFSRGRSGCAAYMRQGGKIAAAVQRDYRWSG